MANQTADVVVIGGGPAGASILWALERATPGSKSLLIEQSETLGAGSSRASLECYRSCWPTPCIAKQMQRSIHIFHNAEQYFHPGSILSLGIRQHGYLFCGFTQRQADALRADVRHLHRMGSTHVAYLDADEAQYRFGWLGPQLIAAKYDPRAGSIDSNALIQAYVKSAPSAQILTGVGRVEICVKNKRVTGVKLPDKRIDSPNVVIAAGANARTVGRSAGVNLPVVVRPRQSFTTTWRHDAFPEDGPMVIGAAPHPHLRPEARSGAIFGWEYTWRNKEVPQEEAQDADALREPYYPLDNLKDSRFPSMTLALLARQFGHKAGEGFADPRYLRGIRHHIGYYVYRDDSNAYVKLPDGSPKPYHSERAILDEHPGVSGLFLSIAHVGHGIMTSPASGEIMAAKILRKNTRPAVCRFWPRRPLGRA